MDTIAARSLDQINYDDIIGLSEYFEADPLSSTYLLFNAYSQNVKIICEDYIKSQFSLKVGKIFWHNDFGFITSNCPPGYCGIDEIFHESMHLVIKDFLGKSQRVSTPLIQLSEALASCLDIYFMSAVKARKIPLIIFQEKRRARQIEFEKRGFLNSVSTEPFAAYKEAVLSMLSMYKHFESTNAENKMLQMTPLEIFSRVFSKVKRLPASSTIIQFDLPNHLLFSRVNGSNVGNNSKDDPKVTQILSQLASSNTLFEFLESLSAA